LSLFLQKIGAENDPAVVHNLKKLHSIPWLAEDLATLDALDDLAQQGALKLAMISAVGRQAAFRVVARILRQGHTGGRRAASLALAEFSGAEANELAIHALDDPDPQVQANIVVQLRQRGIPGALSRIVEKVGSHHAAVRGAVRASLAEFSLDRYLASYDILEEEARVATGALVRKIDDQLLPGLAAEMEAPSRLRRIRAIAVAQTTGVVRDLEAPLLALLKDEDHIVRAESAAALAECDSPAARTALLEALSDRSVTVRDAARESLEAMAEAQGIRATQPWRPGSE
jgi:HEAT repeat protein